MKIKEIVYTNKKQVNCSGKELPFDHPEIFLEIDETDKVTCPYCSKIFLYKNS